LIGDPVTVATASPGTYESIDSVVVAITEFIDGIDFITIGADMKSKSYKK
jgi:hypothetical protein